MAYVITDECMMCEACVDVCEAEAIKAGEDTFVINPDICTSCGNCAEACPCEAIVEIDG